MQHTVFRKGTILSTLTGEEFWAKLQQDPSFLQIDAGIRQRYQHIALGLPAELVAHLDDPFTLLNFIVVRKLTLGYLVYYGYLDLLKAQLASESVGVSDQDQNAVLVGQFLELIRLFNTIIADPHRWLEQRGQTEAELILSGEFGLCPAAQMLYKAGLLTIGRVLSMHPYKSIQFGGIPAE